jgi:hypothetical protein
MDKMLLMTKLEFAFQTPLKLKNQNLVLVGCAETVFFKRESDIKKTDDIIVTLPAEKVRTGLNEDGWNALISLCRFYYKSQQNWKGQ